MPLTQPPFKNWPRHPTCIASLLSYGAPGDLGETDITDLFAAYVVAKGLSDAQGEKLVQKIAQRSVPVNGVVVSSAVIPTFIAQKWFMPVHSEDLLDLIGNGGG